MFKFSLVFFLNVLPPFSLTYVTTVLVLLELEGKVDVHFLCLFWHVLIRHAILNSFN